MSGGTSGRWRALVLGAVLVTVSLACGSGEESVDDAADDANGAEAPEELDPQPGGRLVVGVPLGEPETVLRLLLEPLTTFADDGSVQPYLAESVEPNETYDRWTIRVRPGISFHNGEALDAEAVKANLDTYSVSPTFGTDPFSPIVSTTVVDDLTVEVELAQPWASFPASLTAEQSDGTGLIAAPATIDEMGPLFLADPAAAGVYGTGPFLLDASESSAERQLVRRNPDYWQEGLPCLEELEVVVVPESSDRLAGIDAGDLDLTVTHQLPGDTSAYRVVSPEGETQVLAVAFNTGRAPLDDPTLREALAAATDVEALADTAGVDPAMIASGPFAPGSPWVDPAAQPVAFDEERARELIAEYEATNGPVNIELAAQELEIENVAVQQQLADQWRDAGVDVELTVIEPFEQTATLLVSADFDAVMGRLFGLPDPDLYYFWWHSSALRSDTKGVGYNYVGIDDAELDEALDAVRATPDEDERREALTTVQQRLAASTPYVWLWGTQWNLVASPRVHGLDDAPLPDGGTRLPMVGSRPNLDAAWLES